LWKCCHVYIIGKDLDNATALSDPAPTSASSKKPRFGIFLDEMKPNPGTWFWVHSLFFSHILTYIRVNFFFFIYFSFTHPLSTYTLPPAFSLPSSFLSLFLLKISSSFFGTSAFFFLWFFWFFWFFLFFVFFVALFKVFVISLFFSIFFILCLYLRIFLVSLFLFWFFFSSFLLSLCVCFELCASVELWKRRRWATKQRGKRQEEEQHEKQLEEVSFLQSSLCIPTMIVKVCCHVMSSQLQ